MIRQPPARLRPVSARIARCDVPMDTGTRARFERGWQPARRRRWPRALLLVSAAVLLVTGWAVHIVLDARQRTPQVLQRYLAPQALPLSLDDFPPGYLQLLLAIQDPKFYSHHGVNLLARPGRMTTVTQALVKYLYFERFEPGPLNKIRQTLIAIFALDAAASKQQQLTLFVNTVYLGRLNGWPVHGFEQAAQMYYGRGLTTLSATEFLGLVAMLEAPATYNVSTQPEANAQRVAQLRAHLEKQSRE
jgi:membrane peptidoglycan carboxypeptidase